MKPKRGLYIKKPWTDLILSGKKTWEIRGFNSKIRERIFIIESKTSLIVGECDIIDCIALSLKEFKESKDKHCVDKNVLPYKKTFALILDNVVKYNKPVPHKHKQGTVTWVNF